MFEFYFLVAKVGRVLLMKFYPKNTDTEGVGEFGNQEKFLVLPRFWEDLLKIV